MTKIAATRFATLSIVAAVLITGCTNVTPMLEPDITPPPLESASATPSPSPTATPDVSVAPGGVVIGNMDALGNEIRDTEHFQQYLQFNSVRVYEEGGSTFVDLNAVNSYPDPIVCAVTIRFYDESDTELASASIQMPDGSFMLVLTNGETPLFAHVLSDIGLSGMRFELSFDPNVGTSPLS